MRTALTAALLASSLQQTAAEAWGPAPTPLPELGLKGTALLGGTVLGCSALAGSFAFVRQGEACLIERLGRYKRTLTAGLHPKLPFIESVAAYSSIRERVRATYRDRRGGLFRALGANRDRASRASLRARGRDRRDLASGSGGEHIDSRVSRTLTRRPRARDDRIARAIDRVGRSFERVRWAC